MSRQCNIGLLVIGPLAAYEPEKWDCDFIATPIVCNSLDGVLDDSESKELSAHKNHLPAYLKEINPTLTGIQLCLAVCHSLSLSIIVCAEKTLGLYPSWFDLDSLSDDINVQSETAFRQQTKFIAHFNMRGAIFPSLPKNVENTARVLNAVLRAQSPSKNIKIKFLDLYSSCHWKRWNKLRTMTAYNTKLGVALEVRPHLPIESLHIWLSEPVRVLLLPGNLFINNRSGYPVMTKDHQQFVRTMMHVLSPDIFITEVDSQRTRDYCQYVKFLNRNLVKLTEFEKYAWNFHDLLQTPLQPLSCHLQNQLYETFEKDPIKYNQYEEQTVVGAGRGPLVNCCLKAAQRADIGVHIHAIEKNPNAFVTLQNLKATVWCDNVNIVYSDMRSWKTDMKFDIIVSELLGSFGDNELSPECLDGAQRLLKKNGISIPSSYTTSIAPLSSNRVYTNIVALKNPLCFQTPYVVMFHQTCLLAIPQDLWTFHHPNIDDIGLGSSPINNFHNTRYKKVQFVVEHDCLMHGIAGYFDCSLYKNVKISIHPDTHSPGMFSWFPIFFPVQKPLLLMPGSVITVCFWRLTDKRKVWYEWSVSVHHQGKEIYTSIIHNARGLSYSMDLC
ncbi:PRMT5 arginine-N-methyltransferase-domain-containing protein [Sporodiniella umbellata]|nr:PRMT5 arginine-N-methyltransferase-domain-containing protein [Sporodiniella umbellata]